MIVEPEGRIGPGPFADTLGFRVDRLDTDESVVLATPGPEHLNSGGIVHGGYLAALMDTATGWVVHANLTPGIAAPHLSLNVQYLRAALDGEPIECRARCVVEGRRVIAAEARAFQFGRLIATASSTHLVDDGMRGARPAPAGEAG